MRATAFLVLLVGAGCSSGGSFDGEGPWKLVVDEASIAATGPGGQAWCPASTLAVTVTVTATVGNTSSTTPPASGLTPRWPADLFETSTTLLAAGLTLSVTGDCIGAPIAIATLTIRPPIHAIVRGSIFVVDVGPAARVRLHFEWAGPTGVSGGGWDSGGDLGLGEPGSDPCDGSGCIWIDDSGDTGDDTTDDGGDDGGDGGDTGDDGGDTGDGGDLGDGGDGGDGGGLRVVVRAGRSP